MITSAILAWTLHLAQKLADEKSRLMSSNTLDINLGQSMQF